AAPAPMGASPHPYMGVCVRVRIHTREVRVGRLMAMGRRLVWAVSIGFSAPVLMVLRWRGLGWPYRQRWMTVDPRPYSTVAVGAGGWWSPVDGFRWPSGWRSGGLSRFR